MESRHVLLITYPAQGHLNPSLQFAHRLLHHGIHVTLATTVYAHRRMTRAAAAPLPDGLSFAVFSDGYDDGFNPSSDDGQKYMTDMRERSFNALRSTVLAAEADGHPVTCLVYSLLLPWAPLVAREFNIPHALLWIQPSAVLDIYYYYFNRFQNEIHSKSSDPSWTITVPGIPTPLAARDLPSFLVPSESAKKFSAINEFKEQLEMLDAEERPKVLVNTFDALEPDALTAIEKYQQIAIGPLIPPSFLDGSYSSDKNSFRGDLFVKSSDYIEWLHSKENQSVVYVSFGSFLMLEKPQIEEIAKGLIQTGRPFLWVIRAKEERRNGNKGNQQDDGDDKLSCLEELEKIGKIVPWCSQLEVLTHPSLGCFVTHCGWNSTLESLACGVPVVAFPQWTDQGTNAKLIEDVWRTGARVRVGEGGMVSGGELRRCVEEVMGGGELSRELRRNAEKWRDLARETMGENGSSRKNLMGFLEDFGCGNQ